VLLGRDWSPEEVAELVTKKFIGPLNGFRSKQGRPFSAGLKLSPEFKIEFDFGQGAGSDSDAPVDFSSQESLGACPKCASRVYEHGVSYVCEKSVGPQRSCDFRSGRMILQQPVERAQMQKLLATGRTDLLTGFMSKKNRKFKAFLVKTPQGKIGFEFLPRAEKAVKAPPTDKPAVEKPQKKAAAERPGPKTAPRKKAPARKKRAA
jgi:DNA topoisomerase-3